MLGWRNWIKGIRRSLNAIAVLLRPNQELQEGWLYRYLHASVPYGLSMTSGSLQIKVNKYFLSLTLNCAYYVGNDDTHRPEADGVDMEEEAIEDFNFD